MELITYPKSIVLDGYACGICQRHYGTNKDKAEVCCTLAGVQQELMYLHALYGYMQQSAVPEHVNERVAYLVRRLTTLTQQPKET